MKVVRARIWDGDKVDKIASATHYVSGRNIVTQRDK